MTTFFGFGQFLLQLFQLGFILRSVSFVGRFNLLLSFLHGFTEHLFFLRSVLHGLLVLAASTLFLADLFTQAALFLLSLSFQFLCTNAPLQFLKASSQVLRGNYGISECAAIKVYQLIGVLDFLLQRSVVVFLYFGENGVDFTIECINYKCYCSVFSGGLCIITDSSSSCIDHPGAVLSGQL